MFVYPHAPSYCKRIFFFKITKAMPNKSIFKKDKTSLRSSK